MLCSTQGIVLRTINYSESSIIANIYTRSFGLKSYMIKGVGNSKTKNKNKPKQNSLQPLSILDMVVYEKPNGNIQHIKEFKQNYTFKDIPFNFAKTSIVLFLHEILYKSVREEHANEALFDFIFHSLVALDEQTEHVANFHIYFLVKLSQFLGFAPLDNYSEYHCFFNLCEGIFQPEIPAHNFYLDSELSRNLHGLLQYIYRRTERPAIDYAVRKQLLEKMISYYHFHITGFENIQSHKILNEVLN